MQHLLIIILTVRPIVLKWKLSEFWTDAYVGNHLNRCQTGRLFDLKTYPGAKTEVKVSAPFRQSKRANIVPMRMTVCKITTDVESRMRTCDNRISNRKSNVAFSNSPSVGWMGPIGHYSFFGHRVFGKKVQQYMFIPFQVNNVNGMIHGTTVFRNSSCNIWGPQSKYGNDLIA